MTEHERMPVVVGIDGSASANRAMEWAADEAERRSAPLVVVHAGDLADVQGLSPSTAETVAAEVSAFGRTLLEDAITTLVFRNPSVEVSTRLSREHAAKALITASERAELLVIGRGGAGRLRSLLLGSIAHRVVAHAQCATVVVGEQAATDGETIVVGVSTTPGGYEAMRFACREAEYRNGAPVIGLRSWSDAGFGLAGIGYMVTASQEQWQATEQAILDTWLAQARAEFPTVKITGCLANLPLESAISGRTYGAGLLVLGAPEVQHIGAPRLGPVSSWAIYHARCPVAVTTQPATGEVEQSSVATHAAEQAVSTS